MPQGASRPALHTWNIGANYYVDAVNGNDTTGNGSSGQPWQTLQKAHDVLRDTIVWPTGQDVAVNIRNGTYKAANTAVATLDIFFNNASRCPLSNRFLIWKADTGHTPVIKNPDGTSGQRGCVRIQNGGAARMSYMIFSGLDFDGENTRKGAIGNGNSYALYFGPFGANTADACEVLDCKIHGFQVNGDGVSQSSAQGIATEAGATNLKIVRCKIYDIGTTTLTSDFQEHGIYMKTSGLLVEDTASWNIPNGYNIQLYNSNADSFAGAKILNCTLDSAEASGIIIHGDTDNAAIVNCILSNHTGRGASSWGIEFFPAPTGGAVGSIIDHVVYYNNGTGGSQERSHTPAGWTITNENVDQNPLYVNQGAGDLHLQSGSPAIGYTDTNYAGAVDLEGTARPAGAEDAGAYEFVASTLSGLRLLVGIGD